MKRMLRGIILRALAFPAALLLGLYGNGLAQEFYPNKPIKVVVPFPAGGSADTLVRIVASKLNAAWGQAIIIENHGGAGGNIGADIVAKAQPDGYTILFTPSPPLTVNTFLYKHMPFDASSAFTPVSVLVVMPNILLVGPRVHANNIAGFIADARANPEKLNYGSFGVGTISDLTEEVFESAIGVKIVHIPYKGFAPVLVDLLGGRLDFTFADSTNALSQIRQGKLRGLAIASPKRLFALPDVPTFSEAGVSGVESSSWEGFALPAGTSQEIVRKWQEELGRVAQMPDVRERFEHLGADLWVSTPQEMQGYIEDEKSRWSAIIKRIGIKKQ